MVSKFMKILPIKDKELFLRYAIPCGRVLVKRGELEKGLLERLGSSVKTGKEIEIPVENVFRVATSMCSIIAKRTGKNEIDAEVIRRYFLLEHEKAIKWRQQIRPELKVSECLVYPGRVIKIDSQGIIVKTKLGEKTFRGDFIERLQKNDWVSVHYDYISEKIKASYANKILSRERYE